MKTRLTFAAIGILLLVLSGCASFPPVADRSDRFADGLEAQQIFDRCLAAHGGDIRTWPGDINLSTDGTWYSAIQRIQPIVTDSAFRITSQERYRPSTGLYAVSHAGPEGTKHVARTRDGIDIFYNGVRDTDVVKRSATAMTNDAFRMFHFGPSFFLERAQSMQRLTDVTEAGRRYHRLLATAQPGFGDAAEDTVVLWIDAKSSLLFRVHMSLNGFESTQGAHVDTTFLDYRRVGPFLLPVRFSERVRGPLRIKAHVWHTTGIDLDRGWSDADVLGPALRGEAERPATPLTPQSP